MKQEISQSNVREWTIHQIVHLLRHTALSGSGRPIDNTKPLGALGIGLDSLALLQFITALENQFSVELPDNLWSTYASLSIDSVADIILNLRQDLFIPKETLFSDEYSSQMDYVKPTLHERKSVRRIFKEHGVLLGLLAGIIRFPIRLVHSIIRRDKFHIIAFDLDTQPVPQFHDTIPLTFRNATISDLDAITHIWSRTERAEKSALFQKRLAQGFLGFVAYANTVAVGIDWLSATGDVEKFIGITVSVRDGSCYGLDLNEHPKFRAQGVGMALVAYSLSEAKKRGFKKQYAIVHTDNAKMLGAAIHLLGFRKVGEISTLRLFGKPRSHWTLYDQSGQGTLLVL